MARRKQIEFKGLHGHNKNVEMAVIAFTVACILFAVICIQVVAGA